jgi:hypothetical protein
VAVSPKPKIELRNSTKNEAYAADNAIYMQSVPPEHRESCRVAIARKQPAILAQSATLARQVGSNDSVRRDDFAIACLALASGDAGARTQTFPGR